MPDAAAAAAACRLPPDSPPRCTACGLPAEIVWVHGHGQCSRCGQNTAPCCQPEPADSPQPARASC